MITLLVTSNLDPFEETISLFNKMVLFLAQSIKESIKYKPSKSLIFQKGLSINESLIDLNFFKEIKGMIGKLLNIKKYGEKNY